MTSVKFSTRALGLAQSEVRALFAVANRPEVVNFGGGSPDVLALPVDDIAHLATILVKDHADQALQYGIGQGRLDLREAITEVMAEEFISANPDDVVVTTGSQQALDLVSAVLVDPGDVVLAEAPSYVGALGTFSSYAADVVQVRQDSDGIVPEELERTIAALRGEGRSIKFLYLVPTFQNPSGVTLADHRRDLVIDICARNDILIVEDNPYGLLFYDETIRRPLRSRTSENVIYLGSFSKTFAAGLRVGWVLAPPVVRDKLVIANESAVLSPSNFSQMLVTSYLKDFDWKHQLSVFRSHYQSRRDAMELALTKSLPSVRWTQPAGGFFLWVKLPDGVNSKRLLPRAISHNVAYTPGTGFFADDHNGTSHARLAFSGSTEERIVTGVSRLAVAIDDELELVRAFER